MRAPSVLRVGCNAYLVVLGAAVTFSRLPGLALFLSLGLMASCGGGGGGSAAPAEAAPPPVSSGPQVSGLLPAPPVLGPVLADDALAMRPVRDGSTWAYSGSKLAYKGAAAIAYSTVTKQSVSDNLVVEASTNSSNDGADTQNLSLAQGVVSTTARLDLAGKGQAQNVKFIELRSPVRLGDQYTILDQRFADTNIDADGDKKSDILDAVIYARVMGRELLQLPGLPLLTAIRVDTTVQTRVIYSSNGQSSAVAQSTVQSWYAAGIGLVRQVSSLPTASGTDTETIEESLVYWDGGIAGFGAMPSQGATIPATNSDYPGQPLPLGDIAGTATMGDHALIVTRLPGAGAYSPGGLISRIDLRGQVQSAFSYPGMLVGEGQILGHANGLLHVRVPYTASGDLLPKVEISRFNTDGRLVGSLAGAVIDLRGGRSNAWVFTKPEAAVDGSTLWLFWHRLWPGSNGFDGALVLRPYTFDGVPLADEVVLETRWCCDLLAVSAADGKALVTWKRTVESAPYEYRYATASVGTTSASPMTLVTTRSQLTRPLVPLRLGSRNALLWHAPLDSNYGQFASIGGVLLDAALNPMVGKDGTVLGQEIAGIKTERLVPSVLGSRIFLATSDKLHWWDTSEVPFATAISKSISVGALTNVAPLVFSDRVLLIGYSPSGFRLVWLNAGPV
jgi:hypothetical protein